MVHSIGVKGRRVHLQGIWEGGQVLFYGLGFVVGIVGVSGQLFRQIPNPARQVIGKLGVLLQRPNRVVGTGIPQLFGPGSGNR